MSQKQEQSRPMTKITAKQPNMRLLLIVVVFVAVLLVPSVLRAQTADPATIATE
jgi:hypothetical protein